MALSKARAGRGFDGGELKEYGPLFGKLWTVLRKDGNGGAWDEIQFERFVEAER